MILLYYIDEMFDKKLVK